MNNTQLCIITSYWILTIVGAQLGSRGTARIVDNMVVLFRKAVRATGVRAGKMNKNWLFQDAVGPDSDVSQ